MTDLDLGGKIVQETGVSFNITILEMATIKGQSQKNMTSFWHNMHPGWLDPYAKCIFILIYLINIVNKIHKCPMKIFLMKKGQKD